MRGAARVIFSYQTLITAVAVSVSEYVLMYL